MKSSHDPKKARSNLAKHRISFVEASTVLWDPLAMTLHDPDHSVGELRFVTIGYSSKPRLLVVSTEDLGDNIEPRIISAREATAHERKIYEGKPVV